jgi:hypothetical protein
MPTHGPQRAPLLPLVALVVLCSALHTAYSDAMETLDVNGRPVNATRFKGPFGPDPALGPVLATTGPNKGKPCVDCIFVGVTICCKSWDRTEKLLTQLLASNDNMHVVVFDDMSEDDSKLLVEDLGLLVLQPPKRQNIGLTKIMNLIWRYFYARRELQSMFVVNNDLEISPFRTFEKLDHCLMNLQVQCRICPRIAQYCGRNTCLVLLYVSTRPAWWHFLL